MAGSVQDLSVTIKQNAQNFHAEIHLKSIDRFLPLIWAICLFGWLVALCLVPNPRPLAAPDWAVQIFQSSIGLTEPAARTAATIVLRGVGVGMIGVLLALMLQRLPLSGAIPLVLIVTPMLAIATKWVNFGYFPVRPQLQFFIIAAIVGALAGLSIRCSRFAIASLFVVGSAVFILGATLGVSDDVEDAAYATGLFLLDNAAEISRGDAAFAELLQKAFAYAEDNSHGADAVFANRAAILALGVILGDDQVAQIGRRELDPERAKQRMALRRRVTVRGRNDLSMHFWVSAALTVLTDENSALSVGIVKELADSTPGGSGFSFVDMTANKSGIRFAVTATRDDVSARRMQLRIVEGVEVSQLVPDISGLPEGIPGDQFNSEFGGLGGTRTQELLNEIDRRIGELEGF